MNIKQDIFLRKSLLIFFIVIISALQCSAALLRHKRVLYINSYSPAFPTFMEQYKGILSVLDNSNITIDVEFMDCKKFPTRENIESFKRQLALKLSKLKFPYDAVISGDDYAFDFVVDQQNILFKKIPIAFMGVNNIPKAVKVARNNPLISGIIERAPFAGTIRLIKAMFPHSRRIYVIGDKTISGSSDYTEMRQQCRDFIGDVQLVPLSLVHLSYAQLFTLLSHLHKDDPIMFLSAYEDKDGHTMSYKESMTSIMRFTSAPIFYEWSFGFGDGPLAGDVISHFDQGRAAAEIIRRVFCGEKIANIPVITNCPSKYMCDYQKMKEYDIPLRIMPKGTVFVNKPISFFQLHKKILISAGIIIFICIVFIIFLNVYISKLRNITQKLTLSMNLVKEADETFQAISENSASGIVVTDLEGIIKYSNTFFAKNIVGYAQKALLNVRIADFIKSWDEDMMQLNFRTKDPVRVIFEDKNKELHKTEMVTKEVQIENIHRLLITIHDITIQEQKTQELIEAKQKVEESNRMKEVFIHNLSHEIKTPLNGIMGFTDLLSSDPNDVKANEEYIGIIKSCSKQLMRIINDIIEISRLETKQVHVYNDAINLNDVMNDIYMVFKDNVEAKNLEFIIEKDKPQEECNIMLDGSKLLKILNNLIENALKFTDHGFIKLGYRFEMDYVLFYVQDTGVGIPEKKKDVVFERFAQGEESLLRKYDGLGLGLAIAKENANLLGGDITVQSERGKGTTFFIKLPLRLSPSNLECENT